MFTLLNANAEFTTACSGGISSYIAPPGAAKPYAILYPDDSMPTQTQGNPATQEWKDVVLSVVATTTTQAGIIATLARGILDNYKGTVAGINIKYCKYEGVEEDGFNDELKSAVLEHRYRLCVVL